MKLTKTTALAAGTLAAGLSLTACGTAAKAPAHAQHAATVAAAAPTADGTLTADGYRVVNDRTPAEIAASGGAVAQYITSAAGGWTRDLSKAEAVIILSPAGVRVSGGATAVTAAMQAAVPAGTTVTVTGAPDGSDVIRATGPVNS